jgi:hypothetical protein
MTKFFNWALWVGNENTDFLIAGEVLLPPLVQQDYKIYEYSQVKKPEWSSDCTLFWPFWALSDLFNIQLTDKHIESIRKLAKEKWKVDYQGWLTKQGVDVVAKRWNATFPDKQVLYYSIDLNSNNFIDAVSKWYTVVATYKGNSDYWKDFSDGVLDWIDFKPSTYGHCTDIINRTLKNYVKDSYVGRKYNVYQIKDLVGLVNNEVFYPVWYLYLPVDNAEAKKAEMKRLTGFRILVEANIKNLQDMFHSTTSISFQDWIKESIHILTSKKQDIQDELNKLI